MIERRSNRATAAAIQEALRMKSAFGAFAARQLLNRYGFAPALAERVLAGRYDPRQAPDRPLRTAD